jgi:hypothetical protein
VSAQLLTFSTTACLSLCNIITVLLIRNYSDPDSTLLNILYFDSDLKLGRVKNVSGQNGSRLCFSKEEYI